MSCVGQPVGRRLGASVPAVLAAGLTLAARAEGAYATRAWAFVGLGVLVALAFLCAYGLAMSRPASLAASALLAVGLWAVASTAWGGLPHEAWLAADRAVIGAAALLVGAGLAAHRQSVGLGVLVGSGLIATEILWRVGDGSPPSAWFDGRSLEGPIGYHNGQALLCATALPLALWASAHATARVRALGGGAGATLLAVLLLTQSRAGAAAAAAAVALAVVLARRMRIAVVAGALATGGLVLALELRHVDRALASGTPAGAAGELHAYALAAAATAVAVAAVAAAPAFRAAVRPRAVAVAAAAALAVLAATSVVERAPIARAVDSYTSHITTDLPPTAAPGDTRYATPTLNGRREAWRVAVRAVESAPLSGDGVGRYAVRWGTDRRLGGLYILQPHSIELELASELGLPAAALFLLFVVALAVGLGRALGGGDRVFAAAAAAAAAALVLEASVDWTWSFPGLVVPVLLVAGAATRAGPPRRLLRLVPVVGAALLAVAIPYASASALARGAPTTAARLDPWFADAVSAQALALERDGAFRAAAARYADAAPLSRRPWLEWFLQARALRRAGADGPAAAACLAARIADPLEDGLRVGPCSWPWFADHYPGAHPPGRRR